MNVNCPQCGAGVAIAEETSLTGCASCGSSLWVDLGGLFVHAALDAEIDERAARRLLGAFAPGSTARQVLEPFWVVERGGHGRMAPASSRLVEDVEPRAPLGGRRRPFAALADDVRAGAVEPDVPLATIVGDDPAARGSLLHVPFWVIEEPARDAASAPLVRMVDAVRGRIVVAGAVGGAPPFPGRTFLGMAAAFFVVTLLPVRIALLLDVVLFGGLVVYLGAGRARRRGRR